ncbi:unnamed protein product [Aphanomyces euteiches]
MVTNRCKDLHKSARNKREQYYGEWLPEPFSSMEDDSMEAVLREELLSYAMLVLLERLSPTERIVFVLREALGFEFVEIAELIEKSEMNCRKLLSRARGKMGIAADELVQSESANYEWAHRFMSALKQGNLNQILSMLDPNVLLVTDGGGKVTATIDPVATRELVAQILLSRMRNAALAEGAVMDIVSIHEQPAIVIRSNEGIDAVVMVHVEGNVIRNLYVVRNPDKLKHVDAGLRI